MIVFAHLLNDRSGSPRVLASVIDNLRDARPGRLYVGSGSSGALDDAPVPIRHFWYRRTRHRSLTLLTYLSSQLLLLMRLFLSREIPPGAIVYVNTVLPFGAAIYGRLTRRPVIYHLHESTISPAPLRWLLLAVVRCTAAHVIYVSKFHRSQIPLARVPGSVVCNALPSSFADLAASAAYAHRHDGAFQVLMLASLRDYKGVPEFLELARRLRYRQDIRFGLVANDGETTVLDYFSDRDVPGNVRIHPQTGRPEEHYRRASLVLNLSRADRCQETFGLTIVEAMAFGIPVIVPPVGGPAEIVAHGSEGLHIDSRAADALAAAVEALADDPHRCLAMSRHARRKASTFTEQAFARDIQAVIEKVR
jgi:glycosyltransferase involved in cell wall biosynthesis